MAMSISETVTWDDEQSLIITQETKDGAQKLLEITTTGFLGLTFTADDKTHSVGMYLSNEAATSLYEHITHLGEF